MGNFSILRLICWPIYPAIHPYTPLKKEVKNINEAIIVITNFTAREIRLADCLSDVKEIPFSVDQDLYRHPSNGKFFVNAIFAAGELDIDGNEAITVEDADMVNQIGFNPMKCMNCGMNKNHVQSEGVCPAKGQKCFRCGGRDHFSRFCTNGELRRPPVVTPAQKRHVEKVRRQKELEA